MSIVVSPEPSQFSPDSSVPFVVSHDMLGRCCCDVSVQCHSVDAY